MKTRCHHGLVVGLVDALGREAIRSDTGILDTVHGLIRRRVREPLVSTSIWCTPTTHAGGALLWLVVVLLLLVLCMGISGRGSVTRGGIPLVVLVLLLLVRRILLVWCRRRW